MLVFEPEALAAVARKAQDRHTGARGLRSIMEETLTDLMYRVPSDPTIVKITITGDCVSKGSKPKLERDPERKAVNLKLDAPKKRVRKESAS